MLLSLQEHALRKIVNGWLKLSLDNMTNLITFKALAGKYVFGNMEVTYGNVNSKKIIFMVSLAGWLSIGMEKLLLI